MSLATITGGGSFTNRNIQEINSNFQQLQSIDFWVMPQLGTPSGTGTKGNPFGSFDSLSRYLEPGVRIGFRGVYFGNWTPGAVNNVTIIGDQLVPRQATDSGVANGGGATWLSLATPAATSLVILGGPSTETKPSQAWSFQNIFFNNASTTATTGCVELKRGDGSGSGDRDASHASFLNCKFTGGNYGILDQGGASFVYVDGCQFFNFTGSGDTAIKQGTATGVALPLQWQITNNQFYNNYAHIVTPLSSGNIQNNVFGYIGSSITSTVQVHVDGGGKNNTVWGNFFQMSESTGTATMFGGGTNDAWFNQYADGAVSGVPV